MGYQDYFLAPLSGSIALFFELLVNYLLITMRNLKDERTKIFPSTTRGGKELPSSSALDSPSVMSKFATPTPVIDSDDASD